MSAKTFAERDSKLNVTEPMNMGKRTSSIFRKRSANPFPVTREQLSKMSDDHDNGESLKAFGGVDNLAKALLSNLEWGIDLDSVQLRKQM
jgi:hypothetical protein